MLMMLTMMLVCFKKTYLKFYILKTHETLSEGKHYKKTPNKLHKQILKGGCPRGGVTREPWNLREH